MKILILVMSSKVYQNRIDGILNSYYKLLPSNIDLVFFSDHEDEHVIKLDCSFEYSYKDNVIKTMSSYNLVRDRFYHQYDWYLFIDDDTFVNIPLLNEKISLFDKNFPHGKDITGCWGGTLPYFSGGAGCLVSDEIIHKFFDMKCMNDLYGDVSLGYNMQKRGIKIKHSEYFDSDNPFKKGYSDRTEEDIKNKITYHYCTPEQMQIFTSYL